MGIDSLEEFMPQIMKAGFGIRLARDMIVAAYALQVYDWLLCLSDEYLYIHKARWSSIKIAYLFCRYYPLFVWPMMIWGWVGDHTIPVCNKVMLPLHILSSFCPTAAQAVFIIRTYAFTGRNKVMLAFLTACWMALYGYLLWVPIGTFRFYDEWSRNFGNSACFGAPYSRAGNGKDILPHGRIDVVAIYHLCNFSFDSMMTVIVLVHCVRSRNIRGPVGKVFVQQGLIAYVMLSAITLPTAALYFGSERGWDSISLFLTVATCVIACQLILTLKRRANPTPTSQDRELSDIVRGAMGRLEAAENAKIADDSNQRIDDWH
jgi:hypothetical protein